MKTVKRLFAVALVAFMLFAMAIPFAAVDPEYSIAINGKKDFTATVYKIADFDTETGAFSNFVEKSTSDKSVENAIKDGNKVALLTAAEALSATNLTGKNVASETFTADGLKTVSISDPGVYYVKWTSTGSVSKAQSSVFALPYYNNGSWVKTVTIEDTKTASDAPDASKTFTTADAAEKFAKEGEVINFTLTGSVPGSASLPAQEIKFVDTMDNGLEFNGGLTVYGVTEGGAETALTTGFTTSSPASGAKTFTVTFDSTQTPALYTAGYKTIKITYNAKLTGTGINYTTTGNTNTLTYTYKNSFGVESDPITRTRKVKTFQFKVKKTDTSGNVITDAVAGFTLYTDSTCNTPYTNEVITGEVTTTAGIATFKGLAPATYYVKETTAPNGYNLNSHVFPITISDNGTVTGDGVTDNQLTVVDTKIIVPNTGGEGTLIFTIIGISLIAVAAILFIIYKKKSTSAQ